MSKNKNCPSLLGIRLIQTYASSTLIKHVQSKIQKLKTTPTLFRSIIGRSKYPVCHTSLNRLASAQTP